MSFVERRKLSELLMMYSLEPELKDIYVEGITDIVCYKTVIEDDNINIIEIDSIDFSELYNEKPHLKRNNRNKLIELSMQLDASYGHELHYISCVADTDFDYFETQMAWNRYLYYTDYSSLEMYLFNNNTVDNFFTKILHGFPIPTTDVLRQITIPLVDLFFIRLALKHELGDAYSQLNFIDIKNTMLINKTTGIITFDPMAHLQKILNSNGLMARKNNIENYYKTLRHNSISENRLQIRGHDFIHVLFLVINKIKNSIKLNEEVFDRSIQICVCGETLKTESLIQKLYSKYSA